MNARLFVATVLTTLVAGAMPAVAQQPAPVVMPAVPPHNCVKPELPGRLAMEQPKVMNAFNRETKAYRECIQKYVDDTKALTAAAVAAGNAAVDDFNKLNAEIKAEADKK